LRPVIGKISGVLDNGVSFNNVRDIIDDRAIRTSMDLPSTAAYEQYLINRDSAGNGGDAPLEIELLGAPVDYGYQGIILTVPAGIPCPQGTSPVN
jgi:hypothetical protein